MRAMSGPNVGHSSSIDPSSSCQDREIANFRLVARRVRHRRDILFRLMGATRWLMVLGGVALLVPSVLHCGGRSARTGEDLGGGDAPGATSGGGTAGTTP